MNRPSVFVTSKQTKSKSCTLLLGIFFGIIITLVINNPNNNNNLTKSIMNTDSTTTDAIMTPLPGTYNKYSKDSSLNSKLLRNKHELQATVEEEEEVENKNKKSKSKTSKSKPKKTKKKASPSPSPSSVPVEEAEEEEEEVEEEEEDTEEEEQVEEEGEKEVPNETPIALEITNPNFTPFDTIPKAPTCTSGQSIMQVDALRRRVQEQTYFFTGCGGTEWIYRIRDAEGSLPEDQQLKHFYGINIGSNKGYLISEVITTFMPQLNLNPQELHKYLLSVPSIAEIHRTNQKWACGSCRDCEEIVPPFKNDPSAVISQHISMYGVEPMPETLELTAGWKNAKNIPDNVLMNYNYAINGEDGPVVMAAMHEVNIGKPGDEGAFLRGAVPADQGKLPRGSIVVNGLSVTTFVNRHLPPNAIVDFLLMDMEDFDPYGIKSAEELFKHQRVRTLLAEYHAGQRGWNVHNLPSIITYLDNFGFTCYMLGRHELFRMTNCWDPYYAGVEWGNIVCVLRTLPHWIKATDELTPLR